MKRKREEQDDSDNKDDSADKDNKDDQVDERLFKKPRPIERCLTRLLVFIDFETTDKYPRWAHPVQIGLCACRQFVGKNSFECLPTVVQSYVATERKIHKQATAVHGITSETIRDAPSFATVWSKLVRPWLVGQRLGNEPVILVGHGLRMFDLPVLSWSLKRGGIVGENESPVKFFRDLGITLGLDTLDWARKSLLDLPSKTLSAVYEFIERRQLLQAHDASIDALAVRSIVVSGHVNISANLKPIRSWLGIEGERAPHEPVPVPQPKNITPTRPSTTRCLHCSAVYSSYFESSHEEICIPNVPSVVIKSTTDSDLTVESVN